MSQIKCCYCYQLIDFRASKCQHCGGWEPVKDTRAEFNFPRLSANEKEILKYVVRLARSSPRAEFDYIVRYAAEKIGKDPGTWPHRQTDKDGVWMRWNGDIKFDLQEAFDYVCSVLQNGKDGYIFGHFEPMARPPLWGDKAKITVPRPTAATRPKPRVSQPKAAPAQPAQKATTNPAAKPAPKRTPARPSSSGGGGSVHPLATAMLEYCKEAQSAASNDGKQKLQQVNRLAQGEMDARRATWLTDMLKEVQESISASSDPATAKALKNKLTGVVFLKNRHF